MIRDKMNIEENKIYDQHQRERKFGIRKRREENCVEEERKEA